jgi:hypothetical protein
MLTTRTLCFVSTPKILKELERHSLSAVQASIEWNLPAPPVIVVQVPSSGLWQLNVGAAHVGSVVQASIDANLPDPSASLVHLPSGTGLVQLNVSGQLNWTATPGFKSPTILTVVLSQ